MRHAMIDKKLEKIAQNIKKSGTETFQLLWQFKWWVLMYLSFLYVLVRSYLNPPTPDDPIFNAEATSSHWIYTNQQVYLESLKKDTLIYILILIIALSNMRNHPKLARLIFLSPLLVLVFGLVISVVEEIFGL